MSDIIIMCGIILGFERKTKRAEEKTVLGIPRLPFSSILYCELFESRIDFKNVLLHFRWLRYLLIHPKALRGRFLPALC